MCRATSRSNPGSCSITGDNDPRLAGWPPLWLIMATRGGDNSPRHWSSLSHSTGSRMFTLCIYGRLTQTEWSKIKSLEKHPHAKSDPAKDLDFVTLRWWKSSECKSHQRASLTSCKEANAGGNLMVSTFSTFFAVSVISRSYDVPQWLQNR